MTPPNLPPKLDELLVHASWVRALAARLIDTRPDYGGARDGDADDLAQDVYVAALVAQRRGTVRTPGAWLAGAARKLALSGRRGAARRRAREHAAARPEVSGGPEGFGGASDAGDLVAKAELQGRLIRTVTALPEPLRTTVLLRFFEGLSPSEIGARTGVPASTVRTRLARALERLRMDLDDEHGGDRGAWCAALAQLAGPLVDAGAIAGTASALAGLLAMKGWITIGAAAALLTVAAIAVRSNSAREGRELQRGGGGVAAEMTGEIASTEPALVRPDELGPLAVEPAAAPTKRVSSSAPAPPPVPAGTEPTLFASAGARIVDEHGAPLPGAMLARMGEAGGARAGVDGRVELEVSLEGRVSHVFVASHDGRATRYVPAVLRVGKTTPLGEIELVPGGELHGTVLDARGAPVDGARVFVTPVEDERLDPAARRRLGPELDHPTHGIDVGEDGRFDLPGVTPGPARVWATAPGHGYVATGPVEVAEGPNAPLAITLTPLVDEDVISGVVLAPDGTPTDAWISYDYPHGPAHTYTGMSTDAEGRFRLTVVSRAPHNFLFYDGERRWAAVPMRGVMPGGEELVVRLRETPSIHLLATDERGEPLAEFEAAVADARGDHVDGAGDLASWRRKRGEGRAGELELVTPVLAFHVRVEAVGHEPTTLGPFDPETPPEELTARLRSLPGVSGRVLAGGRPVEGANVVLGRLYDEAELVTYNGFRCRYMSREPGATTDEDGRFTVFASSAGEFVLRAEADGFAAAELELAADPSLAIQGLKIELGRGGTLAGRVLLPNGEDPAGLIVGINHGDGQPRTMRVDSEGLYTFTNLTPGGWHVELRDEELNPMTSSSSFTSNPNPGPLAVSCAVYEGETTVYDLDLRGRVGGHLRGRLVLADGASGWTAALRRIDDGTHEQQEVAQDALDAGGSFELALPEPGAYRLILGSPDADARLRVETTLELREGENAWELPLALGAVDGSFEDPADADAEEVLLFGWKGTAPAGVGTDTELTIRFAPRPGGAFHLPLVPAGPGEISRYTTDERGLTQSEKLTSFTAVEGRAISVTIR